MLCFSKSGMVNIDIVSQLVDSMEVAVLELENAISKESLDEANKLRTFIFDLHLQINSALTGKEGN